MTSNEQETGKNSEDGNTTKEGDEKDPGPTDLYLEQLCILPPLQVSSPKGSGLQDAIKLPPLRPENPVSVIKGAVGEIVGLAQMTNFRLVVEEIPSENGNSNKDNGKYAIADQLPSPYTGKDAVIALSYLLTTAEEKKKGSEVVLDPYSDLSPYLDQGLKTNSCLRMVLERYDMNTIKEHVDRLRLLLDGNAPNMTSLVAPTLAEDEEETEGEHSAETTKEDGGDVEKESKEEGSAAATDGVALEAKAEEKKTLNTEDIFLPEGELHVDGRNLKDFFYLACGEEEALHEEVPTESEKKTNGKLAKKKRQSNDDDDDGLSVSQKMRRDIPRLNRLETICKVRADIQYSKFHPPPPQRRLMGDLAYLDVGMPDGETVVVVTATSLGFYVSQIDAKSGRFDPTPNPTAPCFSHSLLDCLIQADSSFREAWTAALEASKQRAELTSPASTESGFQSLHRVAIRGDYPNYTGDTTGLDQVIHRPTWLVSIPKKMNRDDDEDLDWTHFTRHTASTARMEAEVSSTHGFDIHGGMQRDWNEELQQARELPKSSLVERIERARLIHKTMTEYGEAALAGVEAIYHGLVLPMNPNEPARSHVYLFNNIFFSQAVDSGVETFKLSKGDGAARKGASRDIASISFLHRLDMEGLYVLGTIAIEYLGVRYICQSLVPGILRGEKCHKLLCGAVESNSPLAWDEEVHTLMETNIGKSCLIATRKVPTQPLTEERLAEIEIIKAETPELQLDTPHTARSVHDAPVTPVCCPVEAKAIRGSDQRTYIMDIPRLTPRDPNWIPKSEGGTGLLEGVEPATKKTTFIPRSLDDDELVMAVLRPELVNSFLRRKAAERMQKKEKEEALSKNGKKENASDSKKEANGTDNKNEDNGTDAHEDTNGSSTPHETEEGKDSSKPDSETNGAATDSKTKNSEESDGEGLKKDEKAQEEEEEFMRSLRMNVNVFLPYMRSLDGIDDEAASQLKEDEEQVREVAEYLWEFVLPTLTMDVRQARQLPVDGGNLTDIMHQYGINCRYLGRLAQLAIEQEKLDAEEKAAMNRGVALRIQRRTLPSCWLEMLECEMVARAAKHVLDDYLLQNRCSGSAQPSQIIASFLSALVSEAEETAGETEKRLNKRDGSSFQPDDDDFNALTCFGTNELIMNDGSPVEGRTGVWEAIQKEVGRRFRYQLTLFNQPTPTGRALYIPLLRRVCHRSGIRLAAKDYAVGAKCLCSNGVVAGGRVSSTYPISPVDVIEVVPLIKHCAASPEEGKFVPCTPKSAFSLPSLFVMLPDAANALELARYQYGMKNMKVALDLANEAANLFQQVTDSQLHTNLTRCLDLTAAILFDVKRHESAAATASRSLDLTVQLTGFDSAETASSHQTLAHMCIRSGQLSLAVKHARAFLYLTELLGGHHHCEISGTYHRLANSFLEQREDHVQGRRLYEEALSHPQCDRYMEAIMCKGLAYTLSQLEELKQAVAREKQAYTLYSLLCGAESAQAKSAMQTLESYTKAAVEQGNRQAAEAKKMKEREVADAIASQMVSDEEQAEPKTKKKKNNRRKKKK